MLTMVGSARYGRGCCMSQCRTCAELLHCSSAYQNTAQRARAGCSSSRINEARYRSMVANMLETCLNSARSRHRSLIDSASCDVVFLVGFSRIQNTDAKSATRNLSDRGMQQEARKLPDVTSFLIV